MASTTRTRNPLYAYVGAGDFAVAKLRELPTEIGKLPGELSKLPTRVAVLPTVVGGQVKVLRDQATSVYTDFAVRGERVVGAIRRQPSTKAAKSAASSAKRQAKGATTATEKAAKAAGQAAEDATDKIG